MSEFRETTFHALLRPGFIAGQNFVVALIDVENSRFLAAVAHRHRASPSPHALGVIFSVVVLRVSAPACTGWQPDPIKKQQRWQMES
jgi:hypothetical protein